jgi:transcriptional regulator with XRE-family HTH domain
VYPNLKMEIWLSGIRQNRLARELDVDETVLSKVINGFREPSCELRALLAEYFNKDEGWLFETGPFPVNRGTIRNGTTTADTRDRKSARGK